MPAEKNPISGHNIVSETSVNSPNNSQGGVVSSGNVGDNLFPWKSKQDSYRQALKYMSDIKFGNISTLKCGSPKLNEAFCNGFEWGSAICFAGRPGAGKSVLKEQLIREFYELNPNEDFRTLDWDLEMIPRVTALREFSAVIGKSYKYLLSAEKDVFNQTIDKQEFDRLKEHVRNKRAYRDGLGLPIDVIETPQTVKGFEATVNAYMELHKKPDGTYTKVVVTVDHARLTLKDGMKETDMLQELGAAIIRLKKKYHDSIIIIVFNHLNRKVLEAARCENGKIGNYITDDDILGSDSFLQNFDIVIAVDRPYKRKIEKYGPEMFIIDDPYLLIFHFLKIRNGDTRISFYQGEFDKMRIVEREAPGTARSLNNVRN